ncbi:nitrate regulatory protein [Hydrogenophaga sp. PAMC20947]|uniref:nitrate regulatory protein n=1 Tax=Hydrogenophaga sp. PAMC20947 TaxID=2565558 RepID=UPI00109E00C3|nr:nitrate regulatory protein [Hydrogenophaga sp. PAMC20947]QCB46232.1 ANTAR domain-containing protein [Hydrogenophaga sp. PAMC20947]
MTSGLSFLIAAKRCEIAELERLALTSVLVNATGRLVHGLQRERGLSNLYLASQGARWSSERDDQIHQCDTAQTEVRACFDKLDTEAAPRNGHGARLYSRIAYVLQGLDALPQLRDRIAAQQLNPAQATAAYIRLINGLLAVVFEAADSAADPGISRGLVALFNFMQGKECAGQERATGSALFASGLADAPAQQQLLHLIESQERCLQVFGEFASEAVMATWRAARQPEGLVCLERLRRVLCTTAAGAPLSPDLSQAWFDCCTATMDAMKAVEDQMSSELLALCEQRIASTSAELAAFEVLNGSAPVRHNPGNTTAPGFFDPAASDERLLGTPLSTGGQGFGQQLDRSILELVQEQAHRLQSMSDELDTVRASLNERKLIERAKGLLMAHRSLSEEAAHKAMRQMAMNQNRRVVDVAEAVLAMADVLPEPKRHEV